MLQVNNITMTYRKTRKENFTAVKNVDFEIHAGETLGLIGDSGSGKSTIGQIICGLLKQTEGSISFHNEKLQYPMQKNFRRSIQILFQHPEVSFNPRLKIYDSIKEPYMLYQKNWKKEDIVSDINRFGLRAEHLERYPNELSGGELQRLALTRVLATKPELIVLDEPTSMLDVVSQAQIISMLKAYQKEHNTAYLFISHHISLAEQFCTRMLQIENGIVRPFRCETQND